MYKLNGSSLIGTYNLDDKRWHLDTHTYLMLCEIDNVYINHAALYGIHNAVLYKRLIMDNI